MGTVFVGSSDYNLYAIDTKSGSKLRSFETGDVVDSSPAISTDGATVFAGSWDGSFYAIDVKSGSRLWAFQTGLQVTSSPVISTDGTTVFIASDGLYAISTKLSTRTA